MNGAAFRVLATSMAIFMGTAFPVASWSGESTMPPTFKEVIDPAFANKYKYIEDGEFTDRLKIPVYQWMPAEAPPKVVVIGVHGLTLHGRRYRVLARRFAVGGFGFVSFDLRGFGRCLFDDKDQFSTAEENKKKVDIHRSYDDLVALTKAVKEKYKVPVIVLGESLGCTYCVKLASEHKELVDAVLLSAPAVRVNWHMYATPGDVASGLKAVVSPHHKVNLHQFFTKLVSKRQPVVDEMLEDPFIVKELGLLDLLKTDEFVSKTADFGKGMDRTIPVLILQGSADGCVSPKAVTQLMDNIPSEDQTLHWMGDFGHLQLETVHLRAQIIDTIADWIDAHGPAYKDELADLEQSINKLGGTLVR